MKSSLKKATEKKQEKKDETKSLENNIITLNNLRKDFEFNEVQLKNKLEQRKRNNLEIEKLQNQLKSLEEEIKIIKKSDLEDIKKSTEQKEKEISLMEKTLKEISNKIGEIRINLKNSKDIKVLAKQISLFFSFLIVNQRVIVVLKSV